MPQENNVKDIYDYLAIWLPILFALASLLVSWLAFKNTNTTSKENFINNLRDKIKSAKYEILTLQEKSYTQNEKMIIVEKLQDSLLYQGYKIEKAKFLDSTAQNEIFLLQEEVEDNLSCILAQTDVLINKEQAKNSLNDFLKKL